MPIYTVLHCTKQRIPCLKSTVCHICLKNKQTTVLTYSLQDDRWVARHRKTEAGVLSNTSLK